MGVKFRSFYWKILSLRDSYHTHNTKELWQLWSELRVNVLRNTIGSWTGEWVTGSARMLSYFALCPVSVIEIQRSFLLETQYACFPSFSRSLWSADLACVRGQMMSKMAQLWFHKTYVLVILFIATYYWCPFGSIKQGQGVKIGFIDEYD